MPRYGYTPLPKIISRQSFDERVSSQRPSADIKLLLDGWYSLDLNAVKEFYVLKNLTSMDDPSFWKEALPKLTKYLDGVPFDEDYPDLQVGRSVTEWEVKSAVLYESDPPDCSRVFWLRRDFKGGVPSTAARHWDYYDGHVKEYPVSESVASIITGIVSGALGSLIVGGLTEFLFESFIGKGLAIFIGEMAGAAVALAVGSGMCEIIMKFYRYAATALFPTKTAKNLRSLKAWMSSAIPPERVVTFSEASFESFRSEDAAWEAQLQAWEQKAEEVLQGSLKEIIDTKKIWDADGAGKF